MNRITFAEDKRGNFRIIYNTVEEIEKAKENINIGL
jgi:hypothetical protein